MATRISNQAEKLEGILLDLNEHINEMQNFFANAANLDKIMFMRRLTQSDTYRESENNCEPFLKHKFFDCLTKFYQYLSPACDEWDFTKAIDKRKIDAFDSFAYILNFIVSNSTTFRIEFLKCGGVKELFNFLKNKKFEEKFSKEYFYSTLYGNINWLSRTAETFKNEWRSLNVIELLLHTAQTLNNCRMPAYSAFANIANDQEITTLPDMHVIIPLYTQCIATTVVEMTKTNGTVKRASITFLEDDNNDKPELYDVYFVRIDATTTHSLTGILLTLYRFSINNKIKYDLYVKYNLKETLSVIIYKGSEIEKKYALRLLAQLTFDPQVNDIIFNNTELKSYIQKLSVDPSLQIKSISNICSQILWSLESSHKESHTVSEIGNTAKPIISPLVRSKQVMISYNSASRNLCIKIKEELEKTGFRVWIDVEEIHGSSLEAMAKAIETSDTILLCITEKYRQSINCQAEAQYAFKLQKHIVPLIMQEGYERVDGWLGMIIGDRIYINFIKYDFKQATKRLLHEIKLKNSAIGNDEPSANADFVKVEVKPVHSPPSQHEEKNTNKDAIVKWSEAQVQKWFEENMIHSGIIKEMKPCDGDLLFQMHVLQQEAPEFFYQSITKDKSVDLRSALLFSKKLKELFNA